MVFRGPYGMPGTKVELAVCKLSAPSTVFSSPNSFSKTEYSPSQFGKKNIYQLHLCYISKFLVVFVFSNKGRRNVGKSLFPFPRDIASPGQAFCAIQRWLSTRAWLDQCFRTVWRWGVVVVWVPVRTGFPAGGLSSKKKGGIHGQYGGILLFRNLE